MQRRPPEQTAQQHRIGRRDRRAEYGRQRPRQPEQIPRGDGDEDGGEDGAGPEDERCQQPVRANFFQVERDGVCKQDQDQGQRGDDAQNGRVDGGVEKAKADWPDERAHAEEHGDLRHAGAIDPARQQCRDHNHRGDQGQDSEQRLH